MSRKKHDLSDLTETASVVFGTSGGRVSREFTIREHSREEQDKYVELQQEADEEMVAAAMELGTKRESVVETIKATLTLHWEFLAPVVAFILSEPKDGLPPPTSEDVAQGLNRRKCLYLMGVQDGLDQIPELKKKLEKMNKQTARAQVSARLNGETGTALMTELPNDTQSPLMKSGSDILTDKPG